MASAPYFPGMRAAESLIWAAWLAANPGQFQTLDYNVAVGPGVDPGAAHPPSVRTGAYFNSQRKMDVLAVASGFTTIIEVKERAQLGAIGQLLGYKHLWDAANPDKPPANMMLITARESHGVRGTAAQHGVTFIVQPAPLAGVPVGS